MYLLKNLLLLFRESQNGKTGLNLDFTDKKFNVLFIFRFLILLHQNFFFRHKMIFPFCIEIQPKAYLLQVCELHIDYHTVKYFTQGILCGYSVPS